MKKLLLVFSVCLLSNRIVAQVVINEIMTNNQSTVMDDKGKYSDWIEFYNPTASPINLQGFYLSDNADSLLKWQIPSFSVPAFGFNTIWCSGMNDLTGANIHTNFLIDSQGETIYLSDPAGTVVDNIPAVSLVADKTYGRLPDGSANFVYLSEPSFRSTNNNSTAVTGIISQAPAFSIPGGFYTSAQNISLSHPDPSVTIHYTLDGSDPTENSPVYSGPINVHDRTGEPNYYSMIRTCYNVHPFLPDWNPPPHEVYKCNIVRARAFKNGFFPSPVQTNTYFVDPSIFGRYGNFAVISVVSDPKNLFNDTTGIYVPGINYQPGTFHANYYLDWDRPANIEMFLPDGSLAFNGNFKISINGQSSPSSPQKGLNVNASTDYGPSKIDYPLFKDSPAPARYITKFDKVKLRAWGSDRAKTLFRDAYCANMMAKSGIEVEAYRPVVVFIDGEYWGLQELRERNRNSAYLKSHTLIDDKNPGFDILDGAGSTVLEGDSINWVNMVNFMNTNSLTIPANYDYVMTQLDVNSFMLNYMASIYFARGDWPDQNEAKWRARTADGKWRWFQWDMDNTTGYYLNPWYDMFNLVINGSRGYGPSNVLDELLESQSFKNDFINIFADYMNTEFLPGVATAKVIAMRDELMPFYPEFRDRWVTNYNWTTQVDGMINWLDLRPQYVKQQIITTFGLNGIFNVTLDVSDTAKGIIKVNTVRLDAGTTRMTVNTFPWTGQYFKDVPVPLRALARPGFRFVKWLQTGDTASTIFVNLTSDTNLTALFDVDPNYVAITQPQINEVMSANTTTIADNYGEFDDWVEIYNPNNDTLDLAGYYLTDNMILPARFLFKSGSDSTKIPPQGHLLVWIDNDTSEGILHAPFKFNSSGDFIALIEPDGETVADSLSFGTLADDVSFGRSFDGGPLFINFSPSTPGATNQTTGNEYIAINELQTNNVSTYADNYNQFDPWIELYNPSPDTVDLAGWKISNDPSNMVYYSLPHGNDSTKINPNGFMIIWADGNTSQGILHANFTLQSSGCVSILKPNFVLTDSACYSVMQSDESYGRMTDGNPAWMTFSVPTPDSNNVDLTTVENIITSNLGIRIYPNPATGLVYLNKLSSFTINDALGRTVLSIKNKTWCDVSALEKGIYILKTKSGQSVKLVKE